MDRKRVLIIVGIAVVLIFTTGIIFFKLKTSSSLVSPLTPEVEEEVKLATWEDQAGFSFSYPENIEIDPHEEDMENYAHLELTSPKHQGKILIWVKDTNYLTIEDWVKKEVRENGQIFETELGGEPAKKVAYLEPEKLVTAAIDVDALVLIEMLPDEEGYWQTIYNQILSSFTFIPLEGEPDYAGASPGREAVAPGPWEGAGGAGGIIEEPEEVIE